MIEVNAALGVLAFLCGMILTASIALNVYTQHLLNRCIDVLDYIVKGADKKGETE